MMNELIDLVQQWAEEKGIDVGDGKTQTLKMMAEVGEFADALTKGDRDDIEEELGDVLVTVIVTAQQLGIDPAGALNVAYNKISKRKGTTVNGVFIKETE